MEFAGYYGRIATDMRKLLDDNGLKCCGTHTALDTLEGDALGKTIEYNKCDRQQIPDRAPGSPRSVRKSADDWKKLAAQFDALAEKVAPAGMRVGYHNHNVEFTPLDGEDAVGPLLRRDKKSVIQQVDIGNCLDGGGDPVAYIKRLPGTDGHDPHQGVLEDEAGRLRRRRRRAVEAVFEACETAGGTEWYIVEYEHENQPALPAVDRCLANLRKMGK